MGNMLHSGSLFRLRSKAPKLVVIKLHEQDTLSSQNVRAAHHSAQCSEKVVVPSFVIRRECFHLFLKEMFLTRSTNCLEWTLKRMLPFLQSAKSECCREVWERLRLQYFLNERLFYRQKSFKRIHIGQLTFARCVLQKHQDAANVPNPKSFHFVRFVIAHRIQPTTSCFVTLMCH